MFRSLILLICICAIFSCKDRSRGMKPFKMELKVINNSNKENRITKRAKSGDIAVLMNELDWSKFQKVFLVQKNGDFIKVEGNPEKGFWIEVLLVYELFIMTTPPKTVKEATSILQNYLENADEVLEAYKFY